MTNGSIQSQPGTALNVLNLSGTGLAGSRAFLRAKAFLDTCPPHGDLVLTPLHLWFVHACCHSQQSPPWLALWTLPWVHFVDFHARGFLRRLHQSVFCRVVGELSRGQGALFFDTHPKPCNGSAGRSGTWGWRWQVRRRGVSNSLLSNDLFLESSQSFAGRDPCHCRGLLLLFFDSK